MINIDGRDYLSAIIDVVERLKTANPGALMALAHVVAERNAAIEDCYSALQQEGRYHNTDEHAQRVHVSRTISADILSAVRRII